MTVRLVVSRVPSAGRLRHALTNPGEFGDWDVQNRTLVVAEGTAEELVNRYPNVDYANKPEVGTQTGGRAEITDEGVGYVCDDCGDSFDSPQGLASHSRVH